MFALFAVALATVAALSAAQWLATLLPSRRCLVLDEERLVVRNGFRSFAAPLDAFRGASVYDAPGRFGIRTRPFIVLRVPEPSDAMRRFEAQSGGHIVIALQFQERSDAVAAALSRRLGEWD